MVVNPKIVSKEVVPLFDMKFIVILFKMLLINIGFYFLCIKYNGGL